MNEARVEKVHADRLGARTHLDQAEKFQGDADAGSERRVAVGAADPPPRGSGWMPREPRCATRVTSGDGAHMLRFETALAQLDQDSEDLLERLDASRSRRNEASYAAMLVAEACVEEAREATAELIELARDYLRG